VSLSQTKLTTLSIAKNEYDDNWTVPIDLGEKGILNKCVRRNDDYTNSLIGFELYLEHKRSQATVNSDPETESEPDDITFKKEKLKSPKNKSNDQDNFLKDARDIIHNSIVEGNAVETTVLQMNSLKYAFDTNFIDCAVIILHTLLDECKEEKKEKLLPLIQKIFKSWGSLLAKFVTNEDEQVEIIWGLQEYCEKTDRELYRPQFPYILHTMYEAEILDEDAIWKWVDEQKEAKDSSFLELSKDFLKWLKESEEDSQGEEDE